MLQRDWKRRSVPEVPTSPILRMSIQGVSMLCLAPAASWTPRRTAQ